MKSLFALSSALALSVLIAGSVVAPAYAWHPQGKITKYVQNVTAGGEAKDANTAAAALSAKPGDVLRYTIEVENIAAPASNQYNDMAFTVMKDSLPAGVELISDPAVRSITVDMGLIVPGTSIVKQYDVKVVAATDGNIIENKACFTADSVVKDNAQSGCDVAIVKLTVPVTPVVTPPAVVTPTPTPVVTTAATTPTGGAGVETPETLPNVGIGSNAVVATFAASVFGYVAYALHLKRRAV